MMRSIVKWGTCGLILVSVGCGEEKPAAMADGEQQMPALEVKDLKGNVFVRQRRIASTPMPRDASGRVKLRLPKGPDRDYGKLTDFELAEVLRPKMARDGYEYQLKNPDMELVRQIRANKGADISAPPGQPMGPEGIVEELSGKSVIGGDGRVLHRDNTSYPFSTQMWNDWGCSGTMIGRSTMVTAAHCVHSGTGYFQWPVYRPGVDVQDATPYPFGAFTCYDVQVPGGWDGDTVSEDYAVIEFGTRCGSFPGDQTSWLGFFATDSGSKITDRTNYIYGYPADKAPYPQIWGMGNNSMSTSVFFPARLFYNIDTFGGQSGSGVYQVRDGGRYVVGIHNGNYDSDENQARWLDTTVAAFIRKYSAL